MKKSILLSLSTLVLALPPVAARADGTAPDFAAATGTFRKTLGELVHADTTNPPGNEAKAVAIVAARLKAEGVPYEVVEFAPGRQNIVARLHARPGADAPKPLLLLAHLDVVSAKNQNWSSPPHEMTEKDGYLYGRGVMDDLGMAVGNLEVFLMLKRAGTPLKRDVILALTGDEESGGDGVQYLLKHRPELIDAGIALNEGAAVIEASEGSTAEKPKLAYVGLQAAEKVYQDFHLSTHGTTGHSSVPRKDNAIYRLARALERVEKAPMPAHLVPVARAFFRERAKLEKPELAAAMRKLAESPANKPLPAAALAKIDENPLLHAKVATTCVATMLSGGNAPNALPSEATANVNCRILPDETVAQVRERLQKAIADPEVEVKMSSEFGRAEGSPVDGEVPKAVHEVTEETWHGVPVVLTLQAGATDSRFLRMHGISAYGLSPFYMKEADGPRAHGIDERMNAAAIQPGLEFWYRLVTRLSAAQPARVN